MKIAIVGAGVAGLLLTLLLHSHTTDIILIDPHFDGGELCRSWHTVISNTRWEQAIQALQPYGEIPTWARELSLEQPTTLAQLARLVREVAAPALKSIRILQSTVRMANYTDGSWVLSTSDGQIIKTDSLCIATGGEPKQLHLPIPSIPLDVALDFNRLKSYVQPQDSIVVFGTRHSGTLVLKNCIDVGAKSITGIYKGTKPFEFARDGNYDGIKLDAAAYADSFIGSPPPQLSLVCYTDIQSIICATRTADWVIYATGFEPCLFPIHVNGTFINANVYDATTGKLVNAPSAWGFGLAYPSQAPDGIHRDVGVAPFLEHMARQLPAMLTHDSAIRE